MSDEPETQKKPAAKKPAAKKPAAKKPAAKKPAAKPDGDTKQPEVVDAAAPDAAAQGAAPTEVLEETAAREPEVVVVAAPAKKRKRWPWIVGGVVLLLLVLGVVAFFIADNYAKNYARDYITQRVVEVLGLDPEAPVDVQIGGGSVLLQALAGRLDSVDVAADDVTFGALSGSAALHAEGVPLDEKAATRVFDVTFTLPEEQVVSALTSDVSGFPLESVELEEPEIVASTTLDLFFFTLPVAIGLVPSAEDGVIVLTPETVTLGEDDYTADELREQLGQLAEPFLATQQMCVKDALPVALTIVDVDVVRSDLVLKIDGDGAVLGGPDLTTPGTCAVG
jgi:hypothetical protein